jgi:hypothetical protein
MRDCGYLRLSPTNADSFCAFWREFLILLELSPYGYRRLLLKKKMLLIIALVLKKRKLLERKKYKRKRFWVRKIFERREELGLIIAIFFQQFAFLFLSLKSFDARLYIVGNYWINSINNASLS